MQIACQKVVINNPGSSKPMKKLGLALGVFALALLPAASAHADTFFDFTFIGTTPLNGQPLFSGTGVFDTVADGSGQYLIQGVSGFVNGIAIKTLLAPGSYPVGGGETPNDNILLFPGQGPFGGKFFDHAGVSFQLFGGIDINLNDTGLENAVAGSAFDTELDLVFVSLDQKLNSDPPAATPEPSSLLLLSTGALGAAGAIRRRIKA
jgi:hypothetical protein